MTTNTAFRVHNYGGPEIMTLDDVEIPAPERGQCLVQVKAVGTNPLDWKLREGFLRQIIPLTFPFVLGSEFAGEVIAVGDGVSRFAIGDRVVSSRGSAGGAFADTIAVDETTLAAIPAELSYVEAVALPVGALTGWLALRAAGELRPAMTVLIHGAAGGVGAFAVQFAKAAGAKVFATASAANRDYVRGLGADTVIDYRAERFEDVASNVDLVLDIVGGETLDRSWSVLAPGGAVVTIADPVGIRTRAPEGARAFWHSTDFDPRLFEEIAADVVKGKIRSTIAQVFPKAELPAAIEATRGSHAPGNIVADFTQ
jgi:NADPH:quinone reductase-like Zn-dependent oxidoreductase